MAVKKRQRKQRLMRKTILMLQTAINVQQARIAKLEHSLYGWSDQTQPWELVRDDFLKPRVRSEHM